MNDIITISDHDVAVAPMNLHRQPGIRKRSPKNPKSRPEKPRNDAVAPCSECGKRFSSWKALFGHMRCHPERRWRGINPPPLPSRSRPRLSPVTDEYEVATCLLLLASGRIGNNSNNCAVFECSCCKEVFGSHQALGGHRAGMALAPPATSSGRVFIGPSSAHGLDLNRPVVMEDIIPDDDDDGLCCNYLDLRLAL